MPGSRTISDADRKRAMVAKLLNESSRNISDADREMAKYMKLNDGGIASKTRVF